MKYLNLEQVLYLHDQIINESGGSEGIRDFGLLHSAIERPKASFAGKDLYPDVFAKAAALIHSLVLNHPFIDGNKRTALVSVTRFLKINNKDLKVGFSQLINLALKIESKKMDISDLTVWLKKHC